MKRLIFDIFLILMVFFSPWWLWSLLAILGTVYFSFYYESVIAGLIFDLLYGLSGSWLVFTLFYFILCFFVGIAKIKIRNYA